MKKRIVYVLAVIFTIIYIVWRVVFSLPYGRGWLDMFFGILLLIAEFVGYYETYGYVEDSINIKFPEKPKLKDEDYPDVDVFIATYNEETSLLRKTINGCINMDYPDKSKVHIYICDDNDRQEMAELAREMGVGYFRRDDHKGAKAGNLNNAMKYTSSPYIVTFDADMIPMHDYLLTVIPYFYMENVKMGFVQTPQSFYNTDLFQYNLFAERSVPNEQNFFFKTIQCGRNRSNSVIYAGSNTTLSREALEKVGGFYEKSITEDMATGLEIQTSGYESLALAEVHASGLAPTDIKSLFKQRDRWARGCIQTFRQLHVLRRKGMTPKQKRSYISSFLYWYTPLRRAMFIISPILFSVFNIYLVDASIAEILLIWLPQYVLYTWSISTISRKQRTPRLSNIYDTIMCFYLIPGVLFETVGIKKSKFEVTKKNKTRKIDSKHDRRKYALPHTIALVLSLVGLGICIWNTVKFQSAAHIIIMFWLVSNIYNLGMAIFFISGRKYYRELERFKVAVPTTITGNNFELSIATKDISEGGMSFVTECPIYVPSEKLSLHIESEDGRYKTDITGELCHVIRRRGMWKYAIEFDEVEGKELLSLQQIVYDREPTLPEEVNHHSSMYEDLKNNIKRRGKRHNQSVRKTPRVETYRRFIAENGNYYRMVDFDYSYVQVQNRKSEFLDKLSLVDIEDNKIRFVLTKEKQLNNIRCIYKIENAEDFINNKEFPKMLHQWELKADNRNEEIRKEQRHMERFCEYEFREEQYLQ